ncbi:MAG TPA: hypothetical protein RMH99_16290 [Sandaracinaceae bacterium LLY-WYZ-13_1]|nr:hypothetical protein [Sandaracinaceae bacterium LLY-WYZ-13_1]
MRRTVATALALAALGCGGGGTLAGQVYRDAEARYRVGDLGPGWDRLEMGDNDLAWHHDELGAVVQVNATCDPFQDVPLTSLTNHLLIGFTDREYRSSDVVPLDEREALRSHVVAKLDGVPRELLLYVLKKDECTYDFALIAPPAAGYERAAPAFERFVQGFTTEVGAP